MSFFGGYATAQHFAEFIPSGGTPPPPSLLIPDIEVETVEVEDLDIREDQTFLAFAPLAIPVSLGFGPSSAPQLTLSVGRYAQLAFGPSSAPQLALSVTVKSGSQIIYNLTEGFSVGPPILSLDVRVWPVFPSLLGLTWPITKELIYDLYTQRSASGKVYRIGKWMDPRWRYTLRFEFLRSDSHQEYQALFAEFAQQVGRYGEFLYDDADDDSASNVQFGTGDGSTKSFQLFRSMSAGVAGTAYAPVYALKSTPTIYINGVQQMSGWYVTPLGVVVFSSAPGVNQPLTWSGGYYQLCRFDTDTINFGGIMDNFLDLKELKFSTVKP